MNEYEKKVFMDIPVEFMMQKTFIPTKEYRDGVKVFVEAK